MVEMDLQVFWGGPLHAGDERLRTGWFCPRGCNGRPQRQRPSLELKLWGLIFQFWLNNRAVENLGFGVFATC